MNDGAEFILFQAESCFASILILLEKKIKIPVTV